MNELRAQVACVKRVFLFYERLLQYRRRFESASKTFIRYAAGKPPRALTKTSVNPATTGSESPGGSVRMASITEYCMDLNVHMRVQTRATRAYHRARVRRGSCLLYTSPSPRDRQKSRMPSSA